MDQGEREGRGAAEAFVTSARPDAHFGELLAEVSLVKVEPIRIEIRRGSATVNVIWPTAAAGDRAAWLREWLR